MNVKLHNLWLHTRVTVHGIGAAIISGVATAVTASVVTPDLSYTQLLKMASMGAIIGVIGYFAKSPVEHE